MKSIFILLFIPYSLFGQIEKRIDTLSLIKGFPNGSSYLHTHIKNCYGNYKVPVTSNMGFLICGVERCKNGTETYDYWKVFHLSEVYYIDRTNLKVDDIIFTQILSFDNQKKEAFFKNVEKKEVNDYIKMTGKEIGAWGDIKADYPTYLFSNYKIDNCNADYSNTVKVYDDDLFVIGDTACNEISSKSYIVVYKNKRFMVEKFYFNNSSDIDNTIQFAKRVNPNISLRERLAFDFVKKQTTSKLQELKGIRYQLDSLFKICRDRNLVLRKWSWSYASEKSSFVDLDISVINPYKQRIKYIWFTFKATNPVGDPAKDMRTGQSEKTVQGVGPIEYGNEGSYTFESLFYSKVIETIKVTKIKIQFFDGSEKIITNPLVFGSDQN